MAQKKKYCKKMDKFITKMDKLKERWSNMFELLSSSHIKPT